jgi:MFS transporter, DHA2 family, multidrug resistance protein
VAGQLPGRIGTGLLEAARGAFTHGLNDAALGAALVMAVAAVLSVAFFRGVRVESPAPAAGEPVAESHPEMVR